MMYIENGVGTGMRALYCTLKRSGKRYEGTILYIEKGVGTGTRAL